MKEKIENEIKTAAGRLSNHLKNVEINGSSGYIQYDFMCSEFLDWNDNDIRKSPEHKVFFEEVVNFTGPVLYFFEIISTQDSGSVRECMRAYKILEGSKSVPALKKGYNKDSRILYVGKVKRNFYGRVIQHLGYYKVARTQGLQLFYWAREFGLDVRLHAYHFEPEMHDLVSIFELKFARDLKPIVGKHS